MNAFPRIAASLAAALALAPPLVGAADPDSPPVARSFLGHAAPAARADLIAVPGSLWLVTRRDGRTCFDANPVPGGAPAGALEAPRDPLAPATGIWITTRHGGTTRFDVNPVLPTERDGVAGRRVDPGLVAAR